MTSSKINMQGAEVQRGGNLVIIIIMREVLSNSDALRIKTENFQSKKRYINRYQPYKLHRHIRQDLS